MNHCKPGWKRWAAFVFVLLLLVPGILLVSYQLIWEPAFSPNERVNLFVSLLVVVAVLTYLTLHIFYFGPTGIDYNHEQIVFHFSKKLEKAYPWDQLKKEPVSLHPMGMGYVFLFPDKKKYVINSTMVGYSELLTVLTQKDMLPTTSHFFDKPDSLLITQILKNIFSGKKK